ncbi:MAG TPA: DNA ligase, partial [Candidatus Pacearchaeota archaeon]|nr:DNA ligase [Candidatus Pacearchaeota archaeon]
ELNVFDVIYYNGKSLIDEPFKKRSELVRSIIEEKPYKIVCAKQIITDSEKKAEEFYKKALADNQEGIMMKNLDAPYQSGRRVGHMLKMKPNQRELDLVITGAEYGTGKRSGWMSSFIVSCQDGDEFLEIGKVGTGIKEKSEEGLSFEELTKKLTPLIKKEKGRTVEIKPKLVVSITYQEIQKSPTYNSGFALRFPRVTVLRPDRDTADIATLQEIQEDYDIQQKKKVY